VVKLRVASPLRLNHSQEYQPFSKSHGYVAAQRIFFAKNLNQIYPKNNPMAHQTCHRTSALSAGISSPYALHFAFGTQQRITTGTPSSLSALFLTSLVLPPPP
jgi:hypothetical protein